MLMKTAILFFHNQKQQEAASKHWFKNANLNLRLAGMLIEETRKKLIASGLPVISFDSSLQKGQSFGEKLSNAIEDCFAKHSYEHFIVVGSDTPDLTSTELKKAAILLEQEACPIGLSKDGGIYLFGVSRSKFDPNLFRQIEWCEKKNALSFMAFSEKVGHLCIVIGHKTDFDHAFQLEQVKNVIFQKIWLSIKYDSSPIPNKFPIKTLVDFLDLKPRRGPPMHTFS